MKTQINNTSCKNEDKPKGGKYLRPQSMMLPSPWWVG
jgi:hypothetical protein